MEYLLPVNRFNPNAIVNNLNIKSDLQILFLKRKRSELLRSVQNQIQLGLKNIEEAILAFSGSLFWNL